MLVFTVGIFNGIAIKTFHALNNQAQSQPPHAICYGRTIPDKLTSNMKLYGFTDELWAIKSLHEVVYVMLCYPWCFKVISRATRLIKSITEVSYVGLDWFFSTNSCSVDVVTQIVYETSLWNVAVPPPPACCEFPPLPFTTAFIFHWGYFSGNTLEARSLTWSGLNKNEIFGGLQFVEDAWDNDLQACFTEITNPGMWPRFPTVLWRRCLQYCVFSFLLRHWVRLSLFWLQL